MQIIPLHVVLSDIIAFTSSIEYGRATSVMMALTTSRVSFIPFPFCHVTSVILSSGIYGRQECFNARLTRSLDYTKEILIITLFVVLIRFLFAKFIMVSCLTEVFNYIPGGSRELGSSRSLGTYDLSVPHVA